MKLWVPVLFLATFANCDPQVFHLKDYLAGSTITFDNVETGAQLYLASNDDNVMLNGIQITTGALSISLDLLNKVNADGTPMGLAITDGLTLRTINSNAMTYGLTGFLYLTTKQQADDPTFSVMVIRDKHTITTAQGQKSTVVVLNTALVTDSVDPDKPEKTSYVTAIMQLPDTDLHFHWGIPAWNWTKVTMNQFFENPLYLDNVVNGVNINTTTAFFDNVDPLPINVDYWYVTSTGPVTMSVENKYVSNREYTTNSVNSTGLISNSFLFMQHKVHFLLDYTRTRTVGTLISVWPRTDDYISFFLGNGEQEIDQNFNDVTNVKHALLITQMQASYLIVNSTGFVPGVFFCQYYGITGDLLPVVSTTAGSSTPTKMTNTVASSSTQLTITVPRTSTQVTNTVPSASTVTVMTTTKGSWFPRGFEMISLVFLLVLTL